MSWHGGTSFDPPSATGLASPQQTSTTSASPGDEPNSRKRKRTSIAPDTADAESTESAANGGLDSPSQFNGSRPRHQPGVKRACNDCRQQKLRCNVVAGPGDLYKACDRCIKHNLKCSIDNDFKRLGKRAAHEEMVKELDACRAKLAEYEALGITLPSQGHNPASYAASPAAGAPSAPMTGHGSDYLGANEAAASRSLLDLSQGFRELAPTSYPSITPGTSLVTLRNTKLSEAQLHELYAIYFSSYHPVMPLLDPNISFKEYYAFHPLLHWTIVATASRRYDTRPGLFMELQRPLEEILWTTLSQVPTAYHVCKALALLCTWPLPTSSTTQESTMMLTGIMFQLAMHYGLHRPSHATDFSRFRVELREEDISDRLNTWAAINIVAQSVSTGSGQPPLSRWAWFTYGLHLDRLKPELRRRCQIERFCDTVTRTLFTMQRDHVVQYDNAQRGLQIDMYGRELAELEVTILSTGATPMDLIYVKAAVLHLRLTAFFDKPTQPNYLADLRNVYVAASALLTTIDQLPQEQFLFLPRYIEQMMLAGAITLMKLLNSFYANHVDTVQGRTLFGKTVNALRQLSVRSNDLPQRLAEVTAQLWASSGAGEQKLFDSNTGSALSEPDESLELKVRCRSSLSVLYDAVWRWREKAGEAGHSSLDRRVLENPTSIATDVRPSSTPQPSSGIQNHNQQLAPSHGLSIDGSGDMDPMSWDTPFGGNAVFDTLSWALDGNFGIGQNLFGSTDSLGLGSFNT